MITNKLTVVIFLILVLVVNSLKTPYQPSLAADSLDPSQATHNNAESVSAVSGSIVNDRPIAIRGIELINNRAFQKTDAV